MRTQGPEEAPAEGGASPTGDYWAWPGVLATWYLQCFKCLALLVSLWEEWGTGLPDAGEWYRAGPAGPARPYLAALLVGLAGALALLARRRRRGRAPPLALPDPDDEPPAPAAPSPRDEQPPPAGAPASLATEPGCVHPCWNDRSLRWCRVYEVREIEEHSPAHPRPEGPGIQLEDLAG
eukprot:g21969.t1